MKKVLSLFAGMMMLAPAVFAANALPTVTTFTVPVSTMSPIPVTAFTATDSDGSVIAYMITETSTKPTATAAGWKTTKPISYSSTKTGAITLYAWVKDNAAGVSAAKTATTTLIGGHTHNQSDVVGLAASLAAKADLSVLATKADITALDAKADVIALDAKADVSALAGKSDISHNHDAIYQKKYGSVAVVATSGSDYTSLESALGDSANWCSIAPCLVKVMPGTYTSSSNGLSGIEIHRNITVEGSGEGSTNIICGSMFLYNDGEIRSLTITSPAPINAYYTPVAPEYANATGPAILRNVTLNTTSNDGTGVINYNANLELTNVKINITGPGNGTGTAVNSIFNFTKLNNVTMSVPSAGTAIVSSAYSNVYVANSSIIAPPSATAFTFGDYPGAIFVNNSQINGQITPAGGTVKCVGAFNANYDLVSCQ